MDVSTKLFLFWAFIFLFLYLITVGRFIFRKTNSYLVAMERQNKKDAEQHRLRIEEMNGNIQVIQKRMSTR